MTKPERVVMLAASVIACVAAVVMVPEVRCAAGLDPGCSNRIRFDLLGPPNIALLRAVPPEDSRVGPIRQRYNWIEYSGQLTRYEPVPLRWQGADSANAVVYTDPAGIAKITARVYVGGQLNILYFYYSGRSLIFIHQIQQNLYPRSNRFEQRFYFDEGQMFRWLASDGLAVSSASPEFAAQSRQVARLGADMLAMMQRLQRART